MTDHDAPPDHDAELRAKVRAALADPRPSIPAEDVFAQLEARHAARKREASRARERGSTPSDAPKDR